MCEGLRVSGTPGVAEATESEADQGWGRLCVFLQRLGKKADSRGLNLAHCDLTATDLLELGEHKHTSTHAHAHTQNQRQKHVNVKFVPPPFRAFFISQSLDFTPGGYCTELWIPCEHYFPNMHHSSVKPHPSMWRGRFNSHVKRPAFRSLSPLHLSSATLLHCLPQLEEVDLSWNNLIGCSLSCLTSHLQHVGRVRTLRLCSCRLNADDVTSLGERRVWL